MKKAIFCGPSTYEEDLSSFKNLRFSPPIQQGDLLKQLKDGIQVVGIIDGYFENSPAISHKEILYALENGMIIYGGSSIGALRSAECEQFGMIGIGSVFEKYKSQYYLRDDFVAITHGPKEIGYAPISESYVNIEASFDLAYTENIISCEDRHMLLQVARDVYYKNRNYKLIIQSTNLAKSKQNQLLTWINENKVDIKKHDAIKLIKAVDSLRMNKNISVSNFPITTYLHKLICRSSDPI